MTILVTGATGNAGGAVVRALAAGGFPARALVRNPVELPTGVEPAYGDLNKPDTFVESLHGVSGIFLLSGYDRTDELLANAQKAGVQRVVLLSSSSVVGTDTSNAIAQYHLAAESAAEASGLDRTFLRPNTFMSNTLRWLDQLRAGDVVRVQFPEVPTDLDDPPGRYRGCGGARPDRGRPRRYGVPAERAGSVEAGGAGGDPRPGARAVPGGL